MKLGFIGLGRMGKAMVWNLLEKGIDVIIYNRTAKRTDDFISEFQFESPDSVGRKSGLGSLTGAYKYEELWKNLGTGRIVWIMVEHGPAVDEVIDNLILGGAVKGDIIIDGGNSNYKDSIRRFIKLKGLGIEYLDIGTSGGLEGARQGACLMVGGEKPVFERVKPMLDKMAGEKGAVTYFGEAGAGHFVKTVHNGVEYGMMESIAEGFAILERSLYKFSLKDVASNWSKGSVVRGWLIELLERALVKDSRLEGIMGVVGGGSTGEWTLAAARELKVEVPVIEKTLEVRKKTGQKPSFAGKVNAALRKEFGGHEAVVATNGSK